jgi:hypothetical protein
VRLCLIYLISNNHFLIFFIDVIIEESMLNSAARKKSPKRSPSPSPRRITRASAAAAAAGAAGAKAARASSPSSAKAPKAAATATTRATATAKAPKAPKAPRAATKAPSRAAKTVALPLSPSSPKAAKAAKDPYDNPFWSSANYQVPAKFVMDRESPTPLPRTLAKHKEFIVELKNVLINEKVIDRDSPLFKGLLAEQQKFNMRFFRLKPYNIICFVKCEYELYDKMAPRVFHKGNKEPYYGNFKFVSLLRKNNMDMKWFGDNMLYIHKNRF